MISEFTTIEMEDIPFMKSLKLSVVFASAFIACVFACSCSSVPEDDSLHIEKPSAIAKIIDEGITAESGLDIPPNKVILTSDFADIFYLEKPMKSWMNDEGLIVAQVSAGTRPLGFFRWSFIGINPYKLRYKFIWYDVTGKLLPASTPVEYQIRTTLPGDLVEFSAVAPNEECKIFSFCVEEVDSFKK